MPLSAVLLVVLLLLLIGAVPGYSWSRYWGYMPATIVGILLVIVSILVLAGHL